ncbi:hypothetical protein NCAS_0G01120 [Naumovozyma castellii]|uniref:Uncharacterized protein n=1 Tax=Naumovozyma castellii TaxID=27288 RepID=G0VHW5_NAUCA|nr:hypothetical protein NCAS_0G01120 [Naumovozyma castellii CBS 4309]CCC70999.1 hypothetical protein NCAS_0G01120 [Naumovozyma castellii CBS 4309]
MDTFHNSKRSSISFGSSQRHPTSKYLTSPYKNNGGSSNTGSTGLIDKSITEEDNSRLYTKVRLPLYSPLDFSHPMFSPALAQVQQARNYTTLNPPNSTICEYEGHFPLFGLDWSNDDFVCVSSYKEDSRNKLQLLHSPDLLTWDKIAECNVTYSISNIQWLPSHVNPRKIATSSESLRIWSFNDEENTIQEQINLSLCKYNKQHHHQQQPAPSETPGGTVIDPLSNSVLGELPPITSFHWNPIDTNLLISSSIDTTCIVWDLQSSNYVKTQLIAHDSEVYDVRFLTQSTQLFASCGGDGSVRVFDLRSLAHSTIIYEPPVSDLNPDTSQFALLRLEPSPHDPNVMATFAADSNKILILDMRNPESPLMILEGHSASVNQIKWHPIKRNVLLSGGDDCQVLYWDLNKCTASSDPVATTKDDDIAMDEEQGYPVTTPTEPQNTGRTAKTLPVRVDTPTLCYTNNKNQEINNIVWRPQRGDWFGYVSGRSFQNVRVS